MKAHVTDDKRGLSREERACIYYASMAEQNVDYKLSDKRGSDALRKYNIIRTARMLRAYNISNLNGLPYSTRIRIAMRLINVPLNPKAPENESPMELAMIGAPANPIHIGKRHMVNADESPIAHSHSNSSLSAAGLTRCAKKTRVVRRAATASSIGLVDAVLSGRIALGFNNPQFGCEEIKTVYRLLNFESNRAQIWLHPKLESLKEQFSSDIELLGIFDSYSLNRQYTNSIKLFNGFYLPASVDGRPTIVMELDDILIAKVMVQRQATLKAEKSLSDPFVVPLLRRPFLKRFLADISKVYEIVIFSGADRWYCENIIALIDEEMHAEFILDRRYCDVALDNNGNLIFTKNIRKLGRVLDKVLVIKCASGTANYNHAGVINIPLFEGNPADDILERLRAYLIGISKYANFTTRVQFSI